MEFTKDRFNAITYEAKRTAKTYGFSDEYAEDFAQFALLYISKGRKATVAQLWVDFLRHEFGKKNEEHHEAKLAEKLGYLEMTNIREDFSRYEPTLSSVGKECQSKLHGIERAVFTLLCYGFTLEEIGDMFGVTEGRIGQHMMEIKKKLRENN
jgi:DNA-directed RNA polymerase specialized sigma24 family protein